MCKKLIAVLRCAATRRGEGRGGVCEAGGDQRVCRAAAGADTRTLAHTHTQLRRGFKKDGRFLSELVRFQRGQKINVTVYTITHKISSKTSDEAASEAGHFFFFQDSFSSPLTSFNELTRAKGQKYVTHSSNYSMNLIFSNSIWPNAMENPVFEAWDYFSCISEFF